MGRVKRAALSLFAAFALLAGLMPSGVAATAPSAAPTLVAPANGASVGNSNPILQWTAITGAAKYRVEVSTYSDFRSTVYKVDTVALHATPTAKLPSATYYWRVAGEDAAGAVGTYSSVRTFGVSAVAAPVPVTPTDGQVLMFPGQPVIFSWQPVSGAVSYTVEYDDGADFINAKQATTVNTSYTLTDTQAFLNTKVDPPVAQIWYWHVRATFANSEVTQWSGSRSYSISWNSQPTLRTPTLNASNVKEVELSWDAVAGAARYQIQISPDVNFATTTIDRTVTATRFEPYPTVLTDSYYWRVRAIAAGSAQNLGSWSATFMFTRGLPSKPVVVSPHFNGAGSSTPVVSTLRLDWTPTSLTSGWVDHASYYEVWLGTDGNFSPNTYNICYTNHTTITPYVVQLGGGEPAGCGMPATLSVGAVTYYWRVRGIDGPKNVPGEWDSTAWSNTQQFTYIPPVPLVAPSGTCADTAAPILSWGPVSGAERYHVTITKSNKTSVVQESDTFALAFTPTLPLTATDGPFYWHVEGVDGLDHHGLTVGDSGWRCFNLVPPTGSDTLTIETPLAASASLRMPSMSWTPVIGAEYYKVWYGPSSSVFNSVPLSGSTKLPYAAFTYTQKPLDTGRYYWVVEAYGTVNDVPDTSIATSTMQDFYVGIDGSYGDWKINWDDYVSPQCVPATNPVVTRCVPQVGDTQELRWNPDPNAGAYVVYVSKDANFTNPYRRYVTAFTTLTPRESWLDSQAGQSYYWFVRPCIDWTLLHCGPGPDTNVGLYNSAAYRKISSPVTNLVAKSSLNPPTTGASLADQMTFTWRDYQVESQNWTYPAPNNVSSRVTQEAREYIFQAATASDFNSLSIIEQNVHVDTTSYTPTTKIYPEGPIYWRVQAVDGSGNTLAVSATALVTKASPALTPTSPVVDATVTGVPYFSWVAQNWAASYDVEVYKNGDLQFAQSNRVMTVRTAITAWSPTTALAAGDYTWRVRRVDYTGNPGPWSTGRLFHLKGAAPTLTAPADGANIYSPDLLFTWTGVSGAVAYRFESSVSSSFASIYQSQKTAMPAWAPLATYSKGTYYWRVSVLNASDAVISTSSPTRSFTIDQDATWFKPVSPSRILDTRTNVGTTGGALKGLATRTFKVAGANGQGGVPGVPSNAIAVTGILTTTNATAAGWVSIGANTGAGVPAINFVPNDPIANNVTIKLSSSGYLSIYYGGVASTASVHVIFDVTGYYSRDMTGATFVPVTPTRLLDSRSGLGLAGNTPAKFVRNVAKTIQVTGRKEIAIPSTATAVTGNLAVTGQSAKGWALLSDKAVSPVISSTLNFPIKDVRANGVFVPLGTGGKLTLVYGGAADKATTDFVFDITGYYVPGDGGYHFYPLAQATPVLNTSSGLGLSGKFTTLAVRAFGLTKTTGGASSGVPTSAVAISGSVTAVQPASPGWVLVSDFIVTPVVLGNVKASTLNFPINAIRSNGLVVKTRTGATLQGLYYGSAATCTGSACGTNLKFDVTGYFK